MSAPLRHNIRHRPASVIPICLRFQLFCRAVRQLPIKCQRVYILRRVYGYTQIEIAEQMGISIKTVEAHLTKAIVRCTDYMDEQEDEAIQPPQPGEKHGGRYHG